MSKDFGKSDKISNKLYQKYKSKDSTGSINEGFNLQRELFDEYFKNKDVTTSEPKPDSAKVTTDDKKSPETNAEKTTDNNSSKLR